MIKNIILLESLITLALSLLGVSIYGAILSFQAHIVVGIVGFFLEPFYTIEGLCKIFGDVDLARKIASLIGLI